MVPMILLFMLEMFCNAGTSTRGVTLLRLAAAAEEQRALMM